MSDDLSRFLVARRAFFAKLGVGVAAFGAAAGASAPGGAQTAGAFRPASHTPDDWLDQLPGRHRLVLDATTPGAADTARLYADNFFVANKSGYGLEPRDLAVVIVLRHHATAFAYNDAMWAKYGAAMSQELTFTDPKTKQAPTTNVYNSSGVTLASLIERGVHLAVCGLATRYFAGVLARGGRGSTDDIFKELSANLLGNAHLVSAGIVVVNRAQERGYTFAYVG